MIVKYMQLDQMIGPLFITTHREWIEFIIATVLLWLLMMVAIHELELRTVS